MATRNVPTVRTSQAETGQLGSAEQAIAQDLGGNQNYPRRHVVGRQFWIADARLPRSVSERNAVYVTRDSPSLSFFLVNQ